MNGKVEPFHRLGGACDYAPSTLSPETVHMPVSQSSFPVPYCILLEGQSANNGVSAQRNLTSQSCSTNIILELCRFAFLYIGTFIEVQAFTAP